MTRIACGIPAIALMMKVGRPDHSMFIQCQRIGMTNTEDDDEGDE